jgi:signal transduction histidine kinase/CheY-like chemotaxis protein/PAS domain-containing protein/HPt (histidine-containing phosphotransfer) domain-containing protein
MITISIKTKILFLTIVIILIIAAAILISNIVLFSGFVDDSTIDRVDSATKVAVNSLDSLKAEAKAASLSIAKDPAIISAVVNNNRDELLVIAGLLQDETGVEFCTISDSVGTVIARTHAPEIYGDSVVSQANVQSALYGEPLTALEEGSAVRLSVRAGTPVFDNQGAVAGVISVGYRLDTEQFVNSIKEMMGCETTIALGSERIASTVLGAVGTEADDHIVETVLAGNSYSGRVDILGRVAVCRYTPIDGPDGQALGMLFIGQYLDQELKTIGAFVQGASVITFIMLAVSVAVILIVVRHIVTPIYAMATSASALAVGDTDLDIQVNTKDEMRILSDAFNSMIENTRRQVQIIEHIAAGDLNITLEPRSEKDIMNRALEKLNATIRAQAAALRAEHERIKLMLDATPLASRLWDRDYNLIECNAAAVKLFNLKNKQEYLDQYFKLSPEYQNDGQTTHDKVRALVSEAFEKGTCTYDWTYRMLDGTLIPAEVTMVRVPYGDNYVVAAYSRDLREQQKMMSEIEQRDLLLQTVNQAADTLFRAEPDDFSDTLHQCMGMMARAIDADRMYLYKNHTENGKLYCTQMYEWSENVPPFQGTDITTNVSYDETAPDFKKAYFRGECVNKLIRDTLPEEQALLGAQGVLAVLSIPIFIRDEFWGFVGFDNCHSERLFTENEESVMRSGSLLIANALLRNEYTLSIKITSAKLKAALREAEEANNAKSDFLASMSHEMRTPLNAIIGLSEVILDNDGLDGENKSNLEKIYNSGSTLLSIINDILDISKIQSGKFVIIPNQYDVPSLVNDTIVQNVLRIGSKPIRFILDIDETMPALLYGDELRIKQIINNLLSNAIKYTEEGAVELALKCERDGDTVWLTIRVGDTGVGIRPEHLDHLFTDYAQFGSTSKHQAGGTGLGLAITKNLTQMMEGTIAVDSTYGEGSVFTVRLRQRYVNDITIGAEVAESLKRFHYSTSKLDRNSHINRIPLPYAHVLLVDDNTTNLDVARGLMKPYGMRIDCVTSGQEAIRAVREEKVRYNAIFMDHMMPGMDGIEATRIIREEIGTEYAQTIPIIALTANAIAGNEALFLSKGFQAFISKPIDIMKLDAVLRQWVRDKNREKELFETDTDIHLSDNGKPGASLLTGITINGVDKDKALERFGGDETVFIDVLRSYAAGTRPVLKNLDAYLAAENCEDYAIAVHGIKGSSYAIFAQETGRLAEELENAAKAGNFDAVKAGHGGFEKTAEALLNGIDKALSEINAAADKPIAAKPDPELLRELRDACKTFDMDRVDAAMEELESFRYESGGGLVERLREQVNNMAFEEISGLDLSDLSEYYVRHEIQEYPAETEKAESGNEQL